MIADISFIERRIEEKYKTAQKKLRAQKRTPLYTFLALAIMTSGTLGSYLTLSQAATATRRAPLYFQGRITDANYVPVADTSAQNMVFRIHTHATNSACVWSVGTAAEDDNEETNNCALAASDTIAIPVTITRGVFTVPLGDTSFHANMARLREDFDNQSSEVYYLEIIVENSSGTYETLSPRVRIGSSPYAYNADELDGLNSASFMRTDAVNAQSVAVASGNFISITPSGTTTLTAETRGLYVNFTSGLNPTNINPGIVKGIEVLTPAYTNNTTNATTIRGLGINGFSGTVTHGATASSNADLWSGIDIYMPNLVEGSGVAESWGLSIRRNDTVTAGDSFALFTEINAGNVGFGLTANTLSTSSVPYLLTLGGDAARTLGVGPRTSTGAAGNNLTIIAGNPLSGTDLTGGNLILAGGGSTGTGTSSILFQTTTAGTSGTGNNSPSTKMTILGSGNIGIGDTTPDFDFEILNSSTTADGGILITKTDTSDRDPVIQFSLADGGAVSYTMGVDDSVAGDPFKISTTALGSGDMLTLDSRTTTGAVSAISISPPSGASISFAEAANSTYTTLNLSTPALSISGATVDNITSSWSSYLFQQPGDLTHSASGVTINDAATMRIGGPQQVAGGINITNDYALRIEAGESVASVGTVTNAYGLYVDKPTGATNNYAAIFEGAIGTPLVGIGTATPRTALDVDGTIAFGAIEQVTIDNNNDTFSTSASTIYELDASGGNYTLNSANSIGDGVSAQIIIVKMSDNESNTVTLVNGNNLRLGAATRVLGENDAIVLLFDGGEWIELSYVQNQDE